VKEQGRATGTQCHGSDDYGQPRPGLPQGASHVNQNEQSPDPFDHSKHKHNLHQARHPGFSVKQQKGQKNRNCNQDHRFGSIKMGSQGQHAEDGGKQQEKIQ